MTKKRSNRRQSSPILKQASNEVSPIEPPENVTETCDSKLCSHIVKSINLTKIKRNLKRTGIMNKCHLCVKQEITETDDEHDVAKPLWICLQCGEQSCNGEEQHAVEHYKKPHSDCHCMMVEVQRWSVWCYECETEIRADYRRRLLGAVEFIKKFSATPNMFQQPKMLTMQQQKKAVEPVIVQDNEKFTPLCNFSKVIGLRNLGNTCFFNAVLQCLAQTPYLVKVLDDLHLPGQEFILPGGKHKPNNTVTEIELPPIKGKLERSGSFTSIFRETLSNVNGQNGNNRQVYTPSNLYEKLKKKTTQCMDGGQHDSHEFLRCLLEIVRTEDLRRYQSVILKEVGLSGRTKPDCVEENLKTRIKFYGNQANMRFLRPEMVFRGILVSTLTCLDCHHCSRRTEPFLDLSLPVMPDKSQSSSTLRGKSDQGFKKVPTISNDEHSSEIPSKPTKYEKRTAKRNRKNKMHDLHNSSDMQLQLNNFVEENNFGKCRIRKSDESDADTEDNTELENIQREAGESGYSSGKASTSNSPISLTNHRSKQAKNLEDNTSDNHLACPADAAIVLTNSSLNETEISKMDLHQIKTTNTDKNDEFNSKEEILEKTLSLPIITNPDIRSSEETIASSNDFKKDFNDSFIKTDEATERSEGSNEIKCNAITSNEDSPEKQSLCDNVDDITQDLSNSSIQRNQISSERYIIKEEGESSIQMCLNNFSALELMTGSNKVTCEACTAREIKENPLAKTVSTTSSKQFLISQVPPVLILHLKRFQAERYGFRKVFRHVKFPILLDLAPICVDREKPRLYALYGVVEHSGNIHGGHYVAYVKARMPLESNDPRWEFLHANKDSQVNNQSPINCDPDSKDKDITIEPPPGKWYHVSDTRVTQVDEKTVLQCQAYLLFYERIF